jgi:hypothetical protein
MAHPLESARLKVARAREHLKELDAEAMLFIDSQPYIPTYQYDFDGGWSYVIARKFADPPHRLAFLAGDFAHNLRAALDHLVYALAGLGEEERGDRTQFPIFQKVADYERHEATYLEGVRPCDRTKIRRLQPFEKSNSLLMNLKALDDRDKHRIVDAVLPTAHYSKVKPAIGSIADLSIPTHVVHLEDGAVLARFRAIPDEKGEMRVHCELVPALFFTGANNRMVDVRGFPKLLDVVVDILGDFVPSFDPVPDAGQAPPGGHEPEPGSP